MTAQRLSLGNGRWHLQHGPIDIVLSADGDAAAVEQAHAEAWARFQSVLGELVAELPTLRLPVRGPCPLRGAVARSMWWACRPYRDQFITPMAAVAGAVAEALITAYRRPDIARAWVNNGGDIALHLAAGQSLRVGLFADLARFHPDDLRHGLNVDSAFEVWSALPVRGVATSGWRGRSFSLGIADSVTVLARSAAEADAAATVIANAVNIDDARIVRRPACDLKDDSDLGEMLVTVDVPRLPPERARSALLAGARRAREVRAAGLIWSAALVCQGQWITTDDSAVRALPGEPPTAATSGSTGGGPDLFGSVFA